MANVLVNSDSLTAIADAIRGKTGSPNKLKPSAMPSAIESISGGGSVSVEEKDINFYDYEGTLLYGYTYDEMNDLAELPALLSHDGLICQGWNWELADLQNRSNPMDVGAMYVTDDGATRLYISIVDDADLSAKVRFASSVADGTTIDWGDDTTTVSTSTSSTTYSHEYEAIGDYVISISSVDGCNINTTYAATANMMSSANGRNSSILKKVEIGDNVTNIGAYAFSYCRNLSAITIPKNISSLGGGAFHSCSHLQSITIPKNASSIGNYTFTNCYSLSNIDISKKVISIGGDAFSNCTTLMGIAIPENVASIGQRAFYSCQSLSRISIPESVTSIFASTFYNCYALSKVELPEGITSILASAFYNCSSLSEIVMPESVALIQTNAFYNCLNLPIIEIPEGVTSINDSTYRGCSGLSSMTIPSSVTSIGASAFANCLSIKRYSMLPTTPPTLTSTNAFTGINSDCKIYVPKGCLEAYQTADKWSTYASYMVEMDE